MDKLSPERRSANMRAIRSKDMKPELAVRGLLHKLGYRYRLHRKDLPGKPDIVFPGRRRIIFVDGCFWHQHSVCADGRPPATRQDYWMPKLERNLARDKETRERLLAAGWQILVVWECETRDETELTKRLRSFLGPPGIVLNGTEELGAVTSGRG